MNMKKEEVLKNINKVINKNNEENNEELINEIKNLNKKIDKLNKKIDYVDANLKTNYITIIFGILYFILSNILNFDKYLGINNNLSLIIFLLLLSLFFYKENKIMTKDLIKKLFFK